MEQTGGRKLIMTTLNLLCLAAGALIGASGVVLLSIFFCNAHLPTAGQEHDNAAFGPERKP